MQNTESTLEMYVNLLANYSPERHDELRDKYALSSFSMSLKLYKLYLATSRLSQKEKCLIDTYYAGMGDAIIFLLPGRTLEEVRCYVECKKESQQS